VRRTNDVSGTYQYDTSAGRSSAKIDLPGERGMSASTSRALRPEWQITIALIQAPSWWALYCADFIDWPWRRAGK